MYSHWLSEGRIMSYSYHIKRIWSFPTFLGGGGCICQTWKGSPRGEFWSAEDSQNIMIHPIHPMYLYVNVDVLSLVVWGPNHVLQPSHKAHLTISHFSGRGSCIFQTWKGSPRGEFWSSEDGQYIMIHPIYLSANVDVFSLVVWWPNHVLQPSHQAHLIIKESNMSSNKRVWKETAGSEGSKKKKEHQSTLFLDGDEVLRGLNKAHRGKNLHIPAKVLYSARVPFGQEDYLF
jgi:hypothetical protein